MPLERSEVEKIAHLARLSLSEQQLDKFANSLSDVLDLVNQIKTANTDGIVPMAHPLEEMIQRLRPDAVTEENERDTFQAIAPETDAGLYLVPQVIEE